MKRKMATLFVVLLSFLCLACGRKEATDKTKEGLSLVTSFYPIYALVDEIAGDHNQVTMINSGAGIHDFEPSVADIKLIHDADAFIYHAKSLEAWAADLDAQLQSSQVRVLEASQGLDLERIEGLEKLTLKPGQDPATLLDPHTWTDPLMVGDQAQLIGQLLGELDPVHAADYKQRAQALAQEAEALVAKYAPRFEALSHKTFVTQHTAFSYLARRFGLKQLGITGVAGQEPSPRQLSEIKAFIQKYQVKTIFTEEGVSDKLARSLAAETGVSFVLLPTLEARPDQDGPFLDHLEQTIRILLERLEEEEEK